MSDIVMGVYLLLVAVTDWYKKQIHVAFFVIGIIPILLSCLQMDNISLTERILGTVSGFVMLLVSVVTGEKLGKGDAILLIITGAAMGLYRNISMLAAALLMIFAYSLVLLIRGRFSKNSKVAFVPFLFLGYLTTML